MYLFLINLINILIDQDVISGKDLIDIKKKSSDGDKSQIDAVFELNLTDEDKILDLLVKEQSLDIADLASSEISDEIKSVLPSNYINMNFIAPFKIEGNILQPAPEDYRGRFLPEFRNEWIHMLHRFIAVFGGIALIIMSWVWLKNRFGYNVINNFIVLLILIFNKVI